jgi:hypothetical protein
MDGMMSYLIERGELGTIGSLVVFDSCVTVMPVWILFLPLRVAELYNTCTKKQLASHIGNPGTQPGPRLFTVLCKQLYCSIDSTVQITVPCRRGHCGIGSTVQITVLLPKWYHGSGGTVQITVLGRNWYRYRYGTIANTVQAFGVANQKLQNMCNLASALI